MPKPQSQISSAKRRVPLPAVHPAPPPAHQRKTGHAAAGYASHLLECLASLAALAH